MANGLVEKVFEALTRGIERVLAFAFVAAVCLNFANVMDRRLLGESIAGADEVQIYIMVCMAFLGMVVVTWRRMHLRMDVLAQMLPAAARRGLQFVELVLLGVLAGLTTFQSFRYAAEMYVLDRRSDNAGIPMWLPHGALALGFGLICFITLWRIVRVVRGVKGEVAGGEERGAEAELPAQPLR